MTGGPSDKSIDIVAKCHNEITAIQVKHKTHLKSDEIRRFVDKYFTDTSTPRSLVFVTSADLPPLANNISDQLPPGHRFQLLGRQDVLRLLDAHSKVADRYFGLVKRRLSSQRVQFIAGSWCCRLSGIVAFLLSLYNVPR